MQAELNWLKKSWALPVDTKRSWAHDPDDTQISIERRCELLGLSRSSCYYKSIRNIEEDERLMQLLDRHYTHIRMKEKSNAAYG